VTYRLTRDEPHRFAAAFNFLSSSKNAKHDHVKLEASFLVLQDLPIQSVEIAAKTLAQEASSWMPDDGSWFEVADTHAANALVHDTEVAQLPPGPSHPEEAERASTTAAREAFVQAYETAAQQTLPSDHVWKTPPAQIRSYHCLACRDTGWSPNECGKTDPCTSCRVRGHHLYPHPYVERCVCAATNPALTLARAHAQRAHRLRQNTRGARK